MVGSTPKANQKIKGFTKNGTLKNFLGNVDYSVQVQCPFVNSMEIIKVLKFSKS